MHYCARCGRVKEICLHCQQETGDFRRHLSTYLLVYLSTCLPVYMSTCRPVYPSTCRPVYPSTCLLVYWSTCLPVYCSLLLKHLRSTQGELVCALLCKMWQGKGDMSAMSTGNWGCMETSVYLFTCLPVDLSTRLHVYLSTCLLVDLSAVPYF